MRRIVLATRGSKLALAQAAIVTELLEAQGHEVVIKTVQTRGDRDQTSALASLGGDGLFIREIERELLQGEADIAVHSGKDLAYDLSEGLRIAATPKAAASGDVLLSCRKIRREDRIVIGTGSPRRVAECARLYPSAVFREIRGNVDTRLSKLKRGDYDGVLFARAGLDRLGIDTDEYFVDSFSDEEFTPAPCQGIIAIEVRQDDQELNEILSSVEDAPTRARFNVERYMFGLLRADCSVGIGIKARIESDELKLRVLYDGKRLEETGPYADYKKICKKIQERL